MIERFKILLGMFVFGLGGCARQALPKAEDAARIYAAAVERQDVDALWNMMSREGRVALSKADLKALLLENKTELNERARELRLGPVQAQGRAIIPFDAGEQIELALEDGAFRIDHNQLVAAPADSPVKALQLLRSALLARDYERLRQVLTPEARQQLDDVVKRLEEATLSPERALVDMSNDAATVTLPGGTVVHLKRIDGHWFVTELL